MHCGEGQRGGRHNSVVGGVPEFSHPCLVSVCFIGPSLLEMKFFFRNIFPLVSVLFRGVSKPTSKQKTKAFIASYKTVSATHLRT